MRACFNSICHGIHLDLYVLFGVFFYSTCSYTNAHIIAITVNALSLSKLSENMFCLRHRAPLIAMKQITYLITFVCASHCSNLIYVFPFLLLFFLFPSFIQHIHLMLLADQWIISNCYSVMVCLGLPQSKWFHFES